MSWTEGGALGFGMPEMGSSVGKAIREFKGAVKPAENLLKLEGMETKQADPTVSGADLKG